MIRFPALLSYLGLAALALTAWVAPSTARACSCYATVDLAWPTENAEFPANGLIVLDSFCGGSLDDVTVWVDGVEASLVSDPDRMGGHGLTIVPEPAVGALVELEFVDPEFGGKPGEGLQYSFEVGARDDLGPAAPTLGELDYVIEEVEGGSCGPIETSSARDWSLSIDGQAEEETVVYLVTLGPEGDDGLGTTRRLVGGQEDLELTIRRFEEDAGSNVCARVRTFDMAGNEAPIVSTCQELGRRETLDREGCACSADPSPHGFMGAGLLLLMGGVARRRRR